MKIILIEDPITKKFTGFLDKCPALIVQCDKPEEVHEKMRIAANVMLSFAIQESDMDMGMFLLPIKDMQQFEVITYNVFEQYKLIQEKHGDRRH